MAAPRLPFLYPFLLRPARTGTGKTLSDQAVTFNQRHPRNLHSNAVEGSKSTSQASSSHAVNTAARRQQPEPIFVPGSAALSTTTASRYNAPVNPRTSSTTGPKVPSPTTASQVRSPSRAGFRTSSRRRRPTTATQRYGSANEPPPQLIPPARQLKYQETTPGQRRLPEPTTLRSSPATSTPPTQEPQTTLSGTTPSSTTISTSASPTDPSASLKEPALPIDNPSPATTSAQNASALSTILRMESDDGVNKPPHLTPPPYVHHFDTFTVVRSLEEGGYTEDQSVSITKLMRLVLAENMDLARDGIMSKADAEMSAYLFKAACSELRTEIRNNRTTINERMRTERTSLQHEVDILSQRITADISTLKDDLKGMFDDRKMSVRMERRNAENRIQELNYRITTRLQSEMRSEVEGLRWVLVRRTAIAIASVVVTAFLAARASKYTAGKRVAEEERRAEAARGKGLMVDRGVGGEGPDGAIMKGLAVGDDVRPELVTLG